MLSPRFLTAGLAILFSTVPLWPHSQESSTLNNRCASMEKAQPLDLAQFISAVVPDQGNADCVALAIVKLGQARYEPAVAPLVRLLDFRRPPTPRERQGISLRPLGIWEVYPAAEALSMIGEKALPEVLTAIRAASTPLIARENAVFVWMEIYRRKDDRPKGVALLKHEEVEAKDDGTKARLNWAVSQAIKWCSSSEMSSCKTAAGFGSF